MITDPAHVDWCRRHFSMMADGGTWAVPRSGLVFQRQGDKLVLIAQMPWEDGMPMNAETLAAFQAGDFEVNREHFEAAGITVERT